MKKGFAAYALMVVLISLMAVSLGYSYSYVFSRDWGTSTAEWPMPKQLYNNAFNPNVGTPKLYIDDNTNIRIANISNGALYDTDFPTPSSFDRLTSTTFVPACLGFFAVGQADDGAIYATSLSNPSSILFRWANDAAPMTSQTVAGMLFTRNINATGSGASTKLYVTGSADNGPAQILTTGDGVNFVVSETIAIKAKADVGVKEPSTVWAFDAAPGTAGWPARFDKVGPNWVQSVTFVAPLPYPGATGCYADTGNWIKVAPTDPRYGADGGLVAYRTMSTDAYEGMLLVNDTTGREEAARWLWLADEGINANYYGTVRTDSVNQKIYWSTRFPSPTTRGAYGRLSITYIGTGVSDWELY